MKFKKKDLIFEERVITNMPVPNEVKQLHSLFMKNGSELYVVGGAIRDYLMGKTPKDYDLATDLPADFNLETIELDDLNYRLTKFKLVDNSFKHWFKYTKESGDSNWRDSFLSEFKDKVKILESNTQKNVLTKGGVRFIETGVAFGVINAFVNGEEYEIATFRADSKEGDGRRPDSVIFSDIETDVKRRDLTINALFYDIGKGEIVDLVGGMDDIKNGVVRTVGDAEERFGEDRLRILRAIRFAGRTGSKLDPAIDKALTNNNSLEGISGERIRDEFLKGIKSAKSAKFFLSLIDRYGLFDTIFKGLSPINKKFSDSNNEIISIAILLKDVNYSILSKTLNSLKYSANEIKEIVFLVSFYQTFNEDNFYTLKKLHSVANVNDDTFKDFGLEVGIDINLITRFIQFNLSITGEYITKKFGIGPSKEMGDKIKELETRLFMNK